MSLKNLVIISNESTSKEEQNFFCDNIDIKSIPQSLSENFNVTLIARDSKIKRQHQINIQDINNLSNIFSFLLKIYQTFKKKNSVYLIVSITPYTFFSYIFLFFFRKNIFVYLRSNGYEEYKEKIGFIGPLIYHLMFQIVTFKSNIITCQARLFTKRKSHIVFPSELDSLWFENIKKSLIEKPKLLYIGRLRVEKGIFSLLKILKKMPEDISLSIVGQKKKEIIFDKNINYIGHGYEALDLIKIYDDHNIFILPSFTEAHPKVLDESLAREKPVIIFEEIKHVIQDREGIFISKRNEKSLLETINFIIKNYSKIQEKMKKNKLPTKQDFISKLSNILSSN